MLNMFCYRYSSMMDFLGMGIRPDRHSMKKLIQGFQPIDDNIRLYTSIQQNVSKKCHRNSLRNTRTGKT